MSADAFATAFMVLGVDKTIAFLKAHQQLGIEVYLIYEDEAAGLKTYISAGLKEELEEQN
jgi:thiamine biosynthesis lipoprotein